MNTQDIWSIAGAIIASIGGAGVIICIVLLDDSKTIIIYRRNA